MKHPNNGASSGTSNEGFWSRFRSLWEILSWSNLKKVLGILWYARISVLSMLLLAVALIVSDQGLDLVIALNEGQGVHIKIFLFYTFLTVLGWYHWYLPIFYMPSNYQNKNPFKAWRQNVRMELLDEEPLSAGVRYWLGIATILLGAAAIFKALNVTGVLGGYLARMGSSGFLMASLALYIFLLLPKPVMAIKKLLLTRWFLPVVLGVFLLIALVPAFMNNQGPRFLVFVIIGLWYWAFLFYLFFILREVLIIAKPAPKVVSRGLEEAPTARSVEDDINDKLKERYKMMRMDSGIEEYEAEEDAAPRGLLAESDVKEEEGKQSRKFRFLRRFDVILFGLGMLFSLLFMALNLWPLGIVWGISVPPWTIVGFVSALIFLLIFITAFFYVDKMVKVDLFVIGLILLFLTYSNIDTSFYHVRTQAWSEEAVPYNNREGLISYTQNWLKHRQKDIIDTSRQERYPVYVAASSGGGIRAAYFTSLLASHLSDTSSGAFQQHLFALSGASGGTVGSMFYAGLLQNQQQNLITPGELKDYTRATIFGNQKAPNDFLAPTVSVMLGRDNLGALPLIGSLYRNRAYVLEKGWEIGFAKAFDSPKAIGFDAHFNGVWNTKDTTKRYITPLVFSNSTRVGDGKRAIVGAIDIEPKYFPGAVDFVEDIQTTTQSKDIALSTAALMSARFPFVSPAGRNPSNHSPDRFVDGGFFDNSGATTALNLLQGFDELNAKSLAELFPGAQVPAGKRTLYDLIALNVIKIDNALPGTKVDTIYPDVLSPLKTILSVRSGHTHEADTLLRDKIREIGGNYYHFNLYPINIPAPNNANDSIQPFYPLGWELSHQAVRGIRANLYRGENKRLVKVIREELVPGGGSP